jgi:monoamine oxidase
MPRSQPKHIVIVGAGAAGLMAARELARAGKRVTILEARDRCGGRIQSLSIRDAGRRAEGGAEFVHGEAPVTLGLLREARLSILPIQGTAWTVAEGKFSRRAQDPYTPKFHKALQQLQEDLPIAEFLRRYFAGPEYGGLRRSIERMVESYDAADPERASTLALREEWLNDARSRQARIAGGYGALTDFLVAACREQGGTIRLGAVAKAVETGPGGGASVRCANGDVHAGDVVILTLPLPLLRTIEIPEAVRDKVEAAFGGIGFGNVIKILLGFRTRWWTGREPGLGDLTFLLSDRKIPVWWTQFPAQTALLTGWFGGPGGPRRGSTDRGRVAGRHLSDSDPRSEAKPGGRAGRQLGRRSVRRRSLFICHASDAGGAGGARERRHRVDPILRGSILQRSGDGHRRGGVDQRASDSA